MTPEELLQNLRKNDSFDYGLLPPPITAQDGLDILIHHFLGKNWYSVNSMPVSQTNTEAICEILAHYPQPKYAKKPGLPGFLRRRR